MLEKYNRLTVLYDKFTHKGKRYYHCVCDCGNFVLARAYSIKRGDCSSCGCLNREKTIQRNTIHGDRYSHLYSIWKGMRHRCNCKTNSAFYRYGGRGIKVCSEWDDYLVFKNWALANNYREGLSIERINNSRNYCPENCTWIPLNQQSRNRSTVKLTAQKVKELRKTWLLVKDYMTYKEFAENNQLNKSTMYDLLTFKTWKNID